MIPQKTAEGKRKTRIMRQIRVRRGMASGSIPGRGRMDYANFWSLAGNEFEFLIAPRLAAACSQACA